MRRRDLLIILAAAAALRPLAAQAQQSLRVPVIGWLGLTSAEAFAAQLL